MSHWHDDIPAHSVDMRQFLGFRQSRLTNGMRVLDAYNSSGLRFTLLPDRGMDIWQASYNGIPLTWISQGSPHPPDTGNDWLRQFNGGLLTTCGLTHVGAPETDPHTGEQRGIHGRYTFQRADDVRTLIQRYDDDQWHATADAIIAQSALFGEQLHVQRRYRLTLGEPVLHLDDRITNLGDEPAPLMLLYHCNLGYPLIQQGTELHVASDVYPRDDAAAAGLDHWNQYDRASPGFAEQVFFHHLYTDATDAGFNALVQRDDLALLFTFSDSLPYLTQWKNTRQGIYVNGIEPGNCLPEGRNAAHDSGRLEMIAPGDERHFSLSIRVLDEATTITAAKQTIQHQREHGSPTAFAQFEGL